MSILHVRSTYRLAAGRAGGILILSLWTISLLSTFAVVLSYGVRQKATLVKRLDDRSKLNLIADAAAKKKMVDIITTLSEEYGRPPTSEMEGGGGFSFLNIGDGVAFYSLIDEESKININSAKMPIIRKLLILLLDCEEMKAQSLAASIVDWRDNDSMYSVPIGSAEDREYRSTSYPYWCKDGPYQVPDELLLVSGITAEMYERLKPYITIYGSGKVNINTASREVLEALGMEESVIEIIMLYRRGEDGVVGTADDGIFWVHSRITSDLTSIYNLSESQLVNLTQVMQELVTKSEYFTVAVVAKLSEKGISSKVDCVVDKQGKILRWSES
jgi:general secretion pathway protein K